MLMMTVMMVMTMITQEMASDNNNNIGSCDDDHGATTTLMALVCITNIIRYSHKSQWTSTWVWISKINSCKMSTFCYWWVHNHDSPDTPPTPSRGYRHYNHHHQRHQDHHHRRRRDRHHRHHHHHHHRHHHHINYYKVIPFFSNLNAWKFFVHPLTLGYPLTSPPQYHSLLHPRNYSLRLH